MLSRPAIEKSRQYVWSSSRVEALEAPFLYLLKASGILSIIMALFSSFLVQMGVKAGVVFLSYSSLISGCDNGSTRIDQLTQWCTKKFDGLIVFDECHKAKNLVPESGAKPTKVGRMVLELQQRLPAARVVYCSATGLLFEGLLKNCAGKLHAYLLWT